ncbi:DUF1214 domain-containing protein [Mycolicibacterium sp. XJ1819]
MSTSDDERLQAAWADFCDRLRQAGDRLVFRPTAPDTPQDRAAGYQYIARYITKAIQQNWEFADPMFPQLWHLQTPIHKSFGDNPDCNYLTAVIDGAHTYRVVGNRGTVRWVSFAAGSESAIGSAINGDDLQVEWDGSVEVWYSPEHRTGNWIKTTPGPQTVVIRQFFGHWDTEEPMRLRIERVGATGAPQPPSPDTVIKGLKATMDWLIEDSTRWADWIDFYCDRPNQFVTGMPGWTDGGENSLGRLLHFCYFTITPDEALVIRVTPPDCSYWNFELGNYWMNSVDYRYRLSSINSEQADYQEDGSVVIVVSHADPGILNWLDTAGHTVGFIPNRWVESRESPTPQTKVVKFEDLPDELADVRRIEVSERTEQLRRRKVGVDRRFPA